MRNLFQMLKIPSSLKKPVDTRCVLTRSRVSSAPHLPGDNMTGRYRVPHFGSQILYCRTASEVESTAREIFNTIETLKKSNDTIHAGFDVEWKPSCGRGKSPGKAAVIQICLDPGSCYVMHIFHSGITPGLRELLENSAFTKVGVSIRSDACKVLMDHGVKVHDLMDLSCLANLKFGGKAISWGLRSLAEKLLSIQLKKCNLVQLGNCEAIELSKGQLEYAAANAVASWRIYQVLKSLPDETKGAELEKKKLKTDTTKDDELKKKILKTVTTKADELNIFFFKTDATKDGELKIVMTKGDELKKNILKMALLACKSWMALISDTFSINSHKMKNQKIISTKSPEIITMKVVENINSGVVAYLMDGIKGRHMSCFRLFWTKVDCNLVFTSLVNNGTIIVHCNGLFLIGRTAQCLLVCNPSTREVVPLPPVTYFPDALVDKCSGVGIGLDRSTNQYKVVRIFLRDKGNGGIEVITVDTWGYNLGYNSWRRLKKYPPNLMTYNLTVVTVQGAAYWIIHRHKINERVKVNDYGSLVILRFDLSSEEFTVIDSPDPNQVIKLAELQGHLCCYAQAYDKEILQNTIWVWLYNEESDNIATDRWTLRYTIHHHGSWPTFMPIAIDQEGCLLFECEQHMHRCDPRTKQFYRMSMNDGDADSLEIKTWYCHTTSYVETLVPLSLRTTCD